MTYSVQIIEFSGLLVLFQSFIIQVKISVTKQPLLNTPRLLLSSDECFRPLSNDKVSSLPTADKQLVESNTKTYYRFIEFNLT